MTAYEIFNQLVNELRDLFPIIIAEVEENGESDDLLKLKEYIEKTRVKHNELCLPSPFRTIYTSESKQFIVALTEFLLSIRFIAFGIYNERMNPRTGELLSSMSRIYEFYTNLVIEQLE